MTNYDNFGSSLFSTLRLVLTVDNFEFLYKDILRVSGPAGIAYLGAVLLVMAVFTAMGFIIWLMTWDERQRMAEEECERWCNIMVFCYLWYYGVKCD